MAFEDFIADFDSIDSSLGNIESDITKLKEQLTAGGLTSDQEAQIKERLETLKVKAQAIADATAD